MSRVDGKVYLHLLGKTGTGKSSTGNTILGRKEFNAKSSLSAVTEIIQMGRQGFMGPHDGQRQIVVVDGPGLVGVDTGVSLTAIDDFKQVVNSKPDARHVFLIICRYGERFTEEDEEMVKRLRQAFGREVLENRGIVILTCGDNFERDTEDEGLTFRQWCQQQRGAFADLCKRCQNRVLMVDNSRKSGYQAGSFTNDLEIEVKKVLDRVASRPGESRPTQEESVTGGIKSWFGTLKARMNLW